MRTRTWKSDRGRGFRRKFNLVIVLLCSVIIFMNITSISIGIIRQVLPVLLPYVGLRK